MTNKLKIFLAASVLINSTFANSVSKEEKTISTKVKEKFATVKQHLKKNKRKYAAIIGTGLTAGIAWYLFSEGKTCIICKRNHYRMNTVLLKCCRKSIGKKCFDMHAIFIEVNNAQSISTANGKIYDYPCPNKFDGCAGTYKCKVLKTRL